MAFKTKVGKGERAFKKHALREKQGQCNQQAHKRTAVVYLQRLRCLWMERECHSAKWVLDTFFKCLPLIDCDSREGRGGVKE